MRKVLLAGPAVAAAVLLCVPTSNAGVLVPIPSVPGSTATFVSDINNHNVITGSYTTADGVSHGFFGTLDGTYTTFDVPDGTSGASALDDNGNIIGGAGVSQTCPYYGCGWRRNLHGTIKPLSMNRGPIDGSRGDVSGKAFVGDYRFLDGDGLFNVVPYLGNGTKYLADISLPFNTIHASPRGFDGRGFVEGWFRDRNDGGRDRGFVLKDGIAKAYDYPDDQAFIVQFDRMNSKGWIAGAWFDAEQTFSKAFLFNWKKERFRPISLNGTYVYALSINDAGFAVVDADNVSYLYCPNKTSCPIHGPRTMDAPDEWIPATKVETRFCRNGCLEPHRLARHLKLNGEAIAAARDPEPQRELRLPFRP